MTSPQLVDDEPFISDFASFISASPTSYHAASEIVHRLLDDGAELLDERNEWSLTAGHCYVVIRDGGVIAWKLPDNVEPTTPFNIIGSHTDSPSFKLKPRPTRGSVGSLQAGVEIYGGPLLNSWLDRELELAGRIVTREGRSRLVRTGPFMRIPQLAIHLDREINAGLVLNKQRHIQPVYGVADLEGGDDVLDELARLAGVTSEDIGGFDILAADTQEPRRFGLRDDFFAAGRMDNLSSVYASLEAFQAANPQQTTAVIAAFDHEEVGSNSRSGASGPFLADVLERIGLSLGGGRAEYLMAVAASWCMSADAAHAVHPNYAEKHDPAHHPVLGGGPVLKLNAQQRYATDANGSQLFEEVCKTAGVNFQQFVSNNDVPCGSTIGPLTATRIGIKTFDVGIPLWSMHSAREMCHVRDPADLARVALTFFEKPLT